MTPNHEFDRDLASSIASDVMRVLIRRGFFEALDDLLCPKVVSATPSACQGDYANAAAILRERGFDEEESFEIFSVLRERGACCDCEILYNAVESSRLKAEYWRPRVKVEQTKFCHRRSTDK
jgi:hypothetical protein